MTDKGTVSLQTVFPAGPGFDGSPGFDASPAGIGLAVFDNQRRLLLTNPRFSSLLDLPADRLAIGSGFDDMLTLMASLDPYAGPDGIGFITALRHAAFGPRWTTQRHPPAGPAIEVMADPLSGGGCMILITPQATSEHEAHRRARLLDLVMLNVPHGICVYGPDQCVSMFNDTYNTVMQGAPLSIGDALSDVIRRRAEAGEYGEGDPQTVAATLMAYDTGRPHTRRRVRPNGTAIEVRVAPLPDGGHIRVITDISALVQAEAELRRRAEEMSMMLENIRHGIMLWGPDRRVVASNRIAADMLDLPPGTLIPGQAENEVVARLLQSQPASTPPSPTGTPEPTTHLFLDLDHGVPGGLEINSRSGRVLYAQSNPTPDGGWVNTFTDISQMRHTESELRQAKEHAEAANLAKSRFLATMSHELRTPLNAIIGYSDAMSREHGKLPAQQVVEYADQINDAGKQLLSLINVILDVARIESGRFEPSGEIVNIGKVARLAARQVNNAAQAGEIAVTLTLPEDLPTLRGDERRLIQALSQLLSNAVKFTEAGGAVSIEAGLTDEGDVFVAVTDTGIGIPAGELERVFEPFTQLDGSLSRRYSGAGVGLFMARAIATAHGGHLRLTSLPGEGTVVRITLPKANIVNNAA